MMIFQAANLRIAFTELQRWGFRDFFLPFLLFFAIIFAVLQQIKLFTDEKGGPDRKINAVISGVMSAMIVVPHVVGGIYKTFDPVDVMYNILPASAFIIITVAIVSILMGLVDTEVPAPLMLFIGFGAVAIIVYLFMSNIFPGIGFDPVMDPKLQALIVMLLVFGLIVWFIVRQPKEPEQTDLPYKFWRELFGHPGKK